jgi:uroporphyrinogen decarboxylase
MSLDEAWQRLGHDVAIQGNLDPVALLGPLPEIERRVGDILQRAASRPGHIFNLGHGILPETPVEHVVAVAEMVHARKTGRKAES